MKALLVLLLVAFIAGVYSRPETSTFPTKYDNIDVLTILKNPRLAQNYVGCLKGTKKCTPEGSLLKEAIPKALETDCAGCSPKQKEWLEIALPYISKHYPNDWKELEDVFDPKKIHRTRLAELAKEKHVSV